MVSSLSGGARDILAATNCSLILAKAVMAVSVAFIVFMAAVTASTNVGLWHQQIAVCRQLMKGQLMKLSTALLRAVPGAFILNSGIGKLGMDEETAGGLQQTAATGVPMVEGMSPSEFGKFLSFGEIAVGAALLLPFVPTRIAGAALTTFSAGLVANYFAIDSMTEDDGIRPSQDGIPLAKDTWLAAIGISLMLTGGSKKKTKK